MTATGPLNLCSGQYAYSCNGKPQAIHESWSVCGEPGSLLRIVSERSTDSGQFSLRVNGLYRLAAKESARFFRLRNYEPELVELAFTNSDGEVTASYQALDGRLRLQRSVNAKEIFPATVMESLLLFPLLRIFTGPIVRKLHAVGEFAAVCVPDIRPGRNLDALLTPLISQRRARLLRRGRKEIDGRHIGADCFEYRGGEYPPGTLFWVDDHDVLLGYEWKNHDGETWQVQLQAYQFSEDSAALHLRDADPNEA
ncbi:MAG: hypothetical protein OXC05_13285 [Halieaceae bacterium]|nr:hypothetical protein [Halieaceae bacterium]